MSGQLSPVRSYTETFTVEALFDVGANGDMTLKYGEGITSCADTATGKYTVTFNEVGPKLLNLDVQFHLAADAESLVARYTVDSFSLANKTAAFEVWEIDETGAQVEPASGSDCYIRATFLKSV